MASIRLTHWRLVTCGTFLLVSRTPSRVSMTRTNIFLSSMTATLRLKVCQSNFIPSILVHDICAESLRTTFMIGDWVAHTPKDILAKNFGVDASVFDKVPQTFPYILNGTVSNDSGITSPAGALIGNSSFVYHARDHKLEDVPGGVAYFAELIPLHFRLLKQLASGFFTLEPKGLRELHWHPNVCRAL